MRQWLTQRVQTTRDRGASAVEYGLLVAAIAAVVVGTVFALGGLVRTSFDRVCNGIASQQSQQCVDGQVIDQPTPPPDPAFPPPGAGDGSGGIAG